MGKRRRERDRPKAAHDAPYDPNKRVLLSYASDGEDITGPAPFLATAPPAFGEPIRSIASPIKDRNATTPETKILDSEAGDGELQEDYSEEHEEEEMYYEPKQRNTSSNRISKNVLTGQTPALGSLAYQWEEGDEDKEEGYGSEQEEAMAYLRAVRSERQGIPSIICAQGLVDGEEAHSNGAGDTRGRYEDGAYIVRPSLGPVLPPDLRQVMTPQDVYTNLLKKRFYRQRDYLQRKPTADSIAALDDDCPISLPSESVAARKHWIRILQVTPPLPVQLQLMNQQSILTLLGLIQQRLMHRYKPIPTTLSIWIWSLLSRLDEAGAMNNDHIYCVRELGLHALRLQMSLLNPVMSMQLETALAQHRSEDDFDPEAEDGSENAASASASQGEPSSDCSEIPAATLPERIIAEDEPMPESTLATLDMILVIVGDCFGQRDLLDHRSPWQHVIGSE